MIKKYLFGFMLVCTGLYAGGLSVEYVGFDASGLPTQIELSNQFNLPIELTDKKPFIIKKLTEDILPIIYNMIYPALIKITDEVICAQLSNKLRLAPTIIEDIVEDIGTRSQKMTLAYYNFLVSGFDDNKKLTVHRVEQSYVPAPAPFSSGLKYGNYYDFMQEYTAILNQLIQKESKLPFNNKMFHLLVTSYARRMNLYYDIEYIEATGSYKVILRENLPMGKEQDIQKATDAFNYLYLAIVNGDITEYILRLNTIYKIFHKSMEQFFLYDLDGETLMICDNVFCADAV